VPFSQLLSALPYSWKAFPIGIATDDDYYVPASEEPWPTGNWKLIGRCLKCSALLLFMDLLGYELRSATYRTNIDSQITVFIHTR